MNGPIYINNSSFPGKVNDRVCNEISERGKIEERGKARKRRKSDEQRRDQSRVAREERRNHQRDDRMEAAASEGDISRNRG
jgi:hypothetical protein